MRRESDGFAWSVGAFFSAIGEVETRLSLFTRDAQYLQRAFRRLGVPDDTSLRLLANLFGATLGGLCTSTKSGEPAETKDLTKLVCCPDCKRPLELLHKPSTHFACSRCGAFDVFHGVHVLLRKERSKVLYPKMLESSPETSSKQEFRWKENGPPATVAKEHGQPTERRSPHPLTKGAVIKSVSLLNRNDESVDSIRSGELTTIRVEIEFKEDVPKPVVGFIIRTIETDGTASIVYDTNTMWRGATYSRFPRRGYRCCHLRPADEPGSRYILPEHRDRVRGCGKVLRLARSCPVVRRGGCAWNAGLCKPEF